MFDTVGTHNDDEATQRSFLALLLTSCLVGGTTASTLGFLAYQVAEVAQTPAPEPIDPQAFAQVDLPEEAVPQESAPPLPLPPRGIETAPDPIPPEPDEVAPEQRELEPVTPKPMVSQVPRAGTADGSDDGLEGGAPGGSPGGRPGGQGLGGEGDGDGLRWVHQTTLEAKRRPQIHYPEAARGISTGDQRCVAEVHIDAQGVPVRVQVRDCPEAFHQAAVDGLLRWRWYPPKVDGRTRGVSTKISVLFKE